VEKIHKTGAPILIGTTSIEKSEYLSELLRKRGIKHEVLNAKHHEREAEIVAQAGRLGAVTIATNMAGRGTDIMLGGNPEMLIKKLPEKERTPERIEAIRKQCAEEREKVVAAGGLHIIGTERHESRRIDNQLRGRAGRQGDPGYSRFYVALDDDLMRIFGGERMQRWLATMGFKKGDVIDSPMVSKAIENAQRKVEARNFEIRKQLLEYDDVMNKQREVIYGQRREILLAESVEDLVDDMRWEYAEQLAAEFLQGHADEWDLEGLKQACAERLGIAIDPRAWLEHEGVETVEDIVRHLVEAMRNAMREKEALVGAEQMRAFEKFVLLNVLDQEWKDHLLAMDHLRQSVGLRGYAQKQPIQEYKRESFELFQGLLNRIRTRTVELLHSVQVEAAPPEPQPQPEAEELHYIHGGEDYAEEPKPVRRRTPKVGRNDPCPCGSGKKYKKCCGRRKAA
ncbi:MAG: preprotein translocase subunit SecA, partial [Zetaproteobacteria bacterium]